MEAGTRLGPYEIVEQLGAGGMGEVFRARDARLDRDIAIKVLPSDFAEDEERLARFEREARLLAQLNHANIATIHGLEEAEGVRFIAMECVEGTTLADKIAAEGSVEVEESLEIGAQIALALEAAHETGIVHRDLKPANVAVTDDGNVKVLDFGLAKAFEPDGAPSEISPDLSHSPTRAAATRTGVIMGTAAYMSPEQARGRAVDRRADIWAFGCTLYEMLTGASAFARDTTSDTLAAILKEEPRWEKLPAGTPAAVKRLLHRCLSRKPMQRLQHIGDARIVLNEALQDPWAESVDPANDQAHRSWALVGTVAVAAAVAAFLVGRWSLVDRPWTTGVPTTRLALQIPPEIALELNNGLNAVALSPDGQTVVFAGETAAGSRLYRRRLDGFSVSPIPGTDGAEMVTFSPAGDWIAFTTERDLKKMPAASGEPTLVSQIDAAVGLSRSGYFGGLTWTSRDTIVLGAMHNVLYRVPAAGGRLEQVPVDTDAFLVMPQDLGDGQLLVTLSRGTSANASIAVYDQATGSLRTIVEDGYAGRVLASGHLLFARVGGLHVAALDATGLALSGPAVRVLEEATLDAWGDTALAVSPGGTLVYPADRTANRLVWLTRDGVIEPVTDRRRGFEWPRISPDGRRVAVVIIEPPDHTIYLYNVQSDTLQPFQSGDSDLPVWTPDGERLVFTWSQERVGGQPNDGAGSTPWHLYWRAADGSDEPERLSTARLWHLPSSITGGDNPTLAFWNEAQDLWTIRLSGMEDPTPFAETPFTLREPRFSPGGSHVLYTTDESGRQEVVVRPYPGPGGAIPVSNGGGHDGLWSLDGQEIFYRNGRQIMAASISDSATGSLEIGRPRLLFEGPDLGNQKFYRAWDVTPGGQRFIAVERAPVATLHVVQNWFEELRRLVPTE